jgi:hypothetical protein
MFMVTSLFMHAWFSGVQAEFMLCVSNITSKEILYGCETWE